ncbi:hypothetical protein DER44DRAFT_748445 [Fusarium oxysporum]|nr:hypothetical protein DER44DRAFT_748445 [Fusarium oxysporum]
MLYISASRVIDEFGIRGHAAGGTLNHHIGYQAKLGELIRLRRFGCLLVLLTATLPIVLEDWFRGEMLAKSAVMVRDRTVKPNCRYEVQQVKPGLQSGRRSGRTTLGVSEIIWRSGVVHRPFCQNNVPPG